MVRISSLLVALSASFLAACAREGAAPAADSPQQVTVFTGGPIYTGADGKGPAEAVAISEGVILAVGSHDLVIAGAGDSPEIVDLKGAAMYPGFTDAHAHLLGIGMRELTLNLEEVGSIAELVSIVEANVQHTGENETIFGRGWIETGWPEGRMPTRDDLDPVSADNPVLLSRADGHALVANSAALDAAGIDDETPDPDGGKIERDETGRATGILIDHAQGLVRGLIGETTDGKKREAYAKASDVYTSYGWTGIHAMSVDPGNVDMIEALSGDGALKLRVYNSIDQSGLDALIGSGPRVTDNGRVITRAIKLYMDGALGSRGAALMEAYSDRPDTSGLLLMKKDEAMPVLEKALEAGVQVNTHAIGDRGNKLLLDWYEETFAAHPDKTDIRWRDEHTQILRTEDIPRYAELGVIPSMQPSHAIGDLFFAVDRLGTDRLDGAYPWRSLIDAGSIIAGGSDAPVERGDPRIEFYAAVARRGVNGYSDENWRPDQAVTREEALKMFTIWPAYASFQEETLGTIEPGKRADFTVFSEDIMTIPEEDILTVEPVMTVVDGEIIFRAE
ncbi:amidohydrolase [Hyphococcus sp.]|uniref:amidohydrolase n=1 Tax=Hyphococcus sp. TaxID=2038636 RepID=UPI0035C71AA1